MGSGLTVTPGILRTREHIRSIHSGLLRSMPMMQCGMSQYFITALMPEMMVSLHSSISRQSVVRYGSHSAALISSVSMVLAASLTWVGKPAPPTPTRPQFCTAAIRPALSVTVGGTQAGSTVWAPSVLMVTAVVMAPLTIRSGAMPSTVPDTLE